MEIYAELRVRVEEDGGSPGADGVGSINNYGGKEIKIVYKPPGGGADRTVSVVPYMVGKSRDAESGNQVRKLLAWQYVCDPAAPALPGWRCFKVPRIQSVDPGDLPRPDDLPVLVAADQNCVKKC